MGNEPIWKVERQPAWLVAAIKKTITELPGGYAEAAEWLGVTENALFNRLRVDGDQIFPLGWAIARQSGGVFVPLADIEEVDNADINQRLLEVIEQITAYSQQIRAAIEDGVIEPHERAVIDGELYSSIQKLQEHSALVYRIFCQPEKNDARECAAPGVVANKSMCMEKSA